MVKSEEEVLSDFKELINMTADELEAFLKTDESQGSTGAGWQKSDGSGESVGHESGRKIVEMLKKNPDKDPSKWDEDDKAHARKVVSYCKRHLAQEERMKDTKSPEELEKTRSTISLKNWGHDPLKTIEGGSGSSAKPASKKAADKPKSMKEDSSEKPKSKKDDTNGKPKSTKKDNGQKKDEEEAAGGEKPKSKGKAASAAADKAEDKDKEEKKDSEDAEAGEKRKDEEPAKSDKPASKKAKSTKPATEPTRKPPSRSAKKA